MQRPMYAAAVLLALAAVVRADDVPPAPVVAEAGVAFEAGTPAFADVLAKAKAEGKPAFIDFATDWCVWCKRLDKDVFSKAETAEVMKAFVNVHVDAEKGEGVELAKRFNVHGFPTLVVVDAEGKEIDRVVGYLKLEEFGKEMRRIQSGEGTIPALQKSFAAAPDAATGMSLGAKLADGDPAAAATVYETVASTKDVDHATAVKARLGRAGALAASQRPEEALKEGEALLSESADAPSAGKVVAAVGRAVVAADARRALDFIAAALAAAKSPKERAGIESLLLDVHKNGIVTALRKRVQAAPDEPAALNDAAWTCFEMKLNVKEALGWATTAVEKSGRDPAILDTLANLLWLTGKHADAVKLETEAAGTAADAGMKREFLRNVAKWNAELKLAKEGKEGPEGDDEDDDGDE